LNRKEGPVGIAATTPTGNIGWKLTIRLLGDRMGGMR